MKVCITLIPSTLTTRTNLLAEKFSFLNTCQDDPRGMDVEGGSGGYLLAVERERKSNERLTLIHLLKQQLGSLQLAPDINT